MKDRLDYLKAVGFLTLANERHLARPGLRCRPDRNLVPPREEAGLRPVLTSQTTRTP
jgi:hypothetical protein